MSKIYHTIGCLSYIKSKLNEERISDFKSLKEVMVFQQNYLDLKQAIILNCQTEIEQEKIRLEQDIPLLENEVEMKRLRIEQRLKAEIDELISQRQELQSAIGYSIFQKAIAHFKQYGMAQKIKAKEKQLEQEVAREIETSSQALATKKQRFYFISHHFKEAVNQKAAPAIRELDRKKRIIDSLNSQIYGAIGEQKVVKTLASLSDDYHVINDFTLTFSPALYNRSTNEYIKTVQIDHLLVSPAGLFILETKNWSEKSLQNLSLRSPIEQIRRAQYALYMVLHEYGGQLEAQLKKHHWGATKIPIRNLIVLMQTKPKEAFQYVKVVTLAELISYVTYFKPVFSTKETQRLTTYLLQISDEII